MDEDVDMDAPQISTLREESTPPPVAAKVNTTRRIKLLVNKPSSSTAPPPAARHHQPTQRPKNGDEDGDDDDDDQEDQLIDDDDPIRPSDLPPPPRPAAEASSAGSSPVKKKAPAKRKPRKNDKRPPEEGRLKEKVMQQPGAPNLAPTMLWFEANPNSNSNNPESHEAGPSSEGGQITMLSSDQPLPMKIAGKKKATTKKAPAQKKAKTSSAAAASTSASAPPAPIKQTKIRLLPPPMPDDSGIVSEGMTGTAASSPMAEHFDDVEQTPEPEPLAPLPPATQNAAPPEDINLEGIPVPMYPLPTKPFPVLPPPKIGSGLAPNITFDRSGTKVRHWRVAKREIRGIAGGRWFAQAWVGDKDSAYANHVETQAELRKTIGDSPSHAGSSKVASSASAPVTGKGKAKGKGASLSTSAAPSRSESQAPEAGGASVSVHAPSKMRISQVPIPVGPASEAGDSDMMGPPDS
ncbi:hypothetical protein FB446DRAFT_481463 [Lentinula raphanica]|nr:hypothetical protein FB446DRAFT_481463 [Lentinula raphanica]